MIIMLGVQHGKRVKLVYTAPFCPYFVCVVATTRFMSFINEAIEALISPSCLIINSYYDIFSMLSQEKLSSISIKLGN